MQKVIQFRPFIDCNNHCDFCFNKKYREKLCPTSLLEKRERLDHIRYMIETLPNADQTGIGIIGGELFQGELDGCYNEWLWIIETMQDKDINTIWFTASLNKSEQTVLWQTIDYLINQRIKKNLLICTSFNTGQFPDEEIIIWKENVARVRTMGAKVNCTSILTQDFLDNPPVLPEVDYQCVIEPEMDELDLRHYIGPQYHTKLLERISEKKLRLPKRSDVLDYFSKNKRTAELFADITNHSSKVIDFGELAGFWEDRFNSAKLNAPCGHPWYSQCYADSDACMMCDAVN